MSLLFVSEKPVVYTRALDAVWQAPAVWRRLAGIVAPNNICVTFVRRLQASICLAATTRVIVLCVIVFEKWRPSAAPRYARIKVAKFTAVVWGGLDFCASVIRFN